MKLLLLSLLLPNTLARSAGCGKATSQPLDSYFSSSPTSAPDRSWVERISGVYDYNTPTPLVVYLHGQYGKAETVAREMPFHKHTYNSIIQAFPQGLDDAAQGGSDCGTGWNVIDSQNSHDASTCSAKASSNTCCYKSCLDAGVCTADGDGANCGWATCYDDTEFIMNMIKQLQEELCVGDIYLAGGSNGGMMTHGLYAKYPTMFKNVMPIYGLPLSGHLNVPPEVAATSILELHDRSDTVIPWAGGEAGGWSYESGEAVLGEWAKGKGCEHDVAVAVSTPYDGGAKHLACFWYGKCEGGDAAVMYCLYDGGHGSFPAEGLDLAWWFFDSKWKFLSAEETEAAEEAAGGSGNVVGLALACVACVALLAGLVMRRSGSKSEERELLKY